MTATAKKTDPALWEKVKNEVRAGDKGGHPGEWSARKAQFAVQEYKKRGGGYEGERGEDNHLLQWEKEEWGTKSGGESLETGERYLPKKVREALSDEEYARTTAAKREALAHGEQFSEQPADVKHHAAVVRKMERSRAELLEEAKKRGIAGQSKMTKEELAEALS